MEHQLIKVTRLNILYKMSILLTSMLTKEITLLKFVMELLKASQCSGISLMKECRIQRQDVIYVYPIWIETLITEQRLQTYNTAALSLIVSSISFQTSKCISSLKKLIIPSLCSVMSGALEIKASIQGRNEAIIIGYFSDSGTWPATKSGNLVTQFLLRAVCIRWIHFTIPLKLAKEAGS